MSAREGRGPAPSEPRTGARSEGGRRTGPGQAGARRDTLPEGLLLSMGWPSVYSGLFIFAAGVVDVVASYYSGKKLSPVLADLIVLGTWVMSYVVHGLLVAEYFRRRGERATTELRIFLDAAWQRRTLWTWVPFAAGTLGVTIVLAAAAPKYLMGFWMLAYAVGMLVGASYSGVRGIVWLVPVLVPVGVVMMFLPPLWGLILFTLAAGGTWVVLGFVFLRRAESAG